MAQDKDKTLNEILAHYDQWETDWDQRRHRDGGWNDCLDAYWGKLPEDWPYLSRVVDPRIRTGLLEKKARLTNSKLRGRVVPREGSDVLKARINNSLLDYQWDTANDGGSMNSKWAMMDQDTRMFASSFALTKWKYEAKDGKVVFNGNEFRPVDINDCYIDPNSTHIRDARYFLVREWTTLEDLDTINDSPSEPVFPGLPELKQKIAQQKGGKMPQDRRDNLRVSRVLQNKGLEDHMGDDDSYPVLEIVTEYRRDRFITYSPKHKVILRDIKNPYRHGKIPAVQLRYYPLSDDPIGESEVEAVLPIWRAIQSVVNGFLDNMNIHMRPPLKVIASMTRIETIVYAPEAMWLVDRQDAVQEHQGTGQSLQYFQQAYSSFVAAFNQAWGQMSQGISNADPFARDKTATEIKSITRQQNVMDGSNEAYLAEAITDMMGMWIANNEQFLFADDKGKAIILKIVGQEEFEYFKRMGLDQMGVSEESIQQIGAAAISNPTQIDDAVMADMVKSSEMPLYPVVENPEEKDPTKIKVKPKMSVSKLGDSAELMLEPDDLSGMYDYIPDVKSMSAGAQAEQTKSIQDAIIMLLNPQVQQMLQQENVKTKFKELAISSLENGGLKDAERFFETIQAGVGTAGGAQPPQSITGLPESPSSVSPEQAGQQMAGSPDGTQPGGVLPPLPPSQGGGVSF